MDFIDKIIIAIIDVRNWFGDLAQTVSGWVWPFRELAPLFLWIHDTLLNIAIALWNFREWLAGKWEELKGVFDWDTVKRLILSWLPWLEVIGSWFSNWWANVKAAVSSWWETVSPIVLGWIAFATQGLDALKAAWQNFWTVTLPGLVSFGWLSSWWDSRLKEVQGLIESTIKTWFPFYKSLAQLWQGIEEFFTDPEKWLYEIADKVLERFW